MGLWFPAAGRPRPPRPKPRDTLGAYLVMVVRDLVVIVGGLILILLVPWP